MSGRRWLVEIPTGDQFHDVGADDFDVIDGAAVFHNDGDPVVAYAAGRWLTVSENHEGDQP